MSLNTFFVLSSASRSRKLIFQNIGLNFKSQKPLCDESKHKKRFQKLNFSPKKVSLELAKIKAKSVSSNKKDTLVVGSDTVIYFNGKILKKAQNNKEAAQKIKQLSGKKHEIISSAATYYNSNLVWSFSEKTVVKIRNLNDLEIKNYLRSCGKDILSSVGCYQIEKKGPAIIEEITGDFFNVMGFPLFPFLDFLKKTKKQ